MSTQTSAYQPPWSTITIMWFARGADYAAYEMVHTKIANFGSFVPNRLQCDLHQKLIISRSNFQCLLSIFQRSINWFLKCTAYKNWLHTDMTEYTISRCPTEMWHAISNHSCIIHACISSVVICRGTTDNNAGWQIQMHWQSERRN